LAGSDVRPDYPLSAREEGVTGEVVLGYVVNAEGRVENVKVARSSGDDRLDRAALAAARRWRYRPAVRNGLPQSVKWRRTLHFTLR
jgi:periplasmic protein TonB